MTSQDFKNLHVVDHPLLAHKLTLLRDENTSSKLFQELTYEITLILGLAATETMETIEQVVTTPLTDCTCESLRHRYPTIVPILRAGLGMVDPLLALIPTARVGHIGIARDETTLEPTEYYFKMPADYECAPIFIVDPMLATGGSLAATIEKLRERDCGTISVICIVTAPEGVKLLLEQQPDVMIYTASLDECLNDRGYILPGLGDAGDDCNGLADPEKLAKEIKDYDLYHPWDLSVEQALDIALEAERSGLEFDKRIKQSEGASLSTHQSYGVYANTHDFIGTRASSRHSLSVAIPHARVETLDEIIGCLVYLPHGIDYDAPDHQAVNFFFGMVVPAESHEDHLKLLAQLAELFSQEKILERLRKTTSSHELYEATILSAYELQELT